MKKSFFCIEIMKMYDYSHTVITVAAITTSVRSHASVADAVDEFSPHLKSSGNNSQFRTSQYGHKRNQYIYKNNRVDDTINCDDRDDASFPELDKCLSSIRTIIIRFKTLYILLYYMEAQH